MMKKSKFLKSSKDMLSRSFNPSKCKTSLRLAGSRLKLLRNKKEVQVKQMKREIAQLLESGQDQTARIRVEHVVREEKMMAAYDLIELYCELVVARLPIIESQKICPIDLKEAITSVVFASPRCGDVPELLDVKKHFTDKYGKDFITAAVELRPDCGVSRLLVEKLSAVAPDGPTKIKILSTIAEEHNVKWDPKSFQDNTLPAGDLLNGPSTFQDQSKLHVEPSHFEGQGHWVPQTNKVHGSSSNFTQMDDRTSLETERLASNKISGIDTAFRHETRPPSALGGERSQLFQEDSSTISHARERWNMQFKDATSAAQAAAESAELASMAARAAAELSSGGRIMRQYSTESHDSGANISKDGRPEAYMNSKLVSGQSSEESMNKSFSGHSRLQNEEIDRVKPNNLKIDERFTDHASKKEYSQSASLKSKASFGNESLDHGIPVADGYSRKNSLNFSRGEMKMQRESFEYKADSANGQPAKAENVREERIHKQPSVVSSPSHSRIYNDMKTFSNSEDQKFEYGGDVDSSWGFGKKGIYGEASQRDSHESTAVVFDKSDSDSENHVCDARPTYDEPEQGLHSPLSGLKSYEHLSTNTDSWNPRSSTSKTVNSSSSLFLTRKSSSSDFSEGASKLDDSMPLTFDESDGPSSESDEDKTISRHSRTSGNFLSRQDPSIGPQFKDKSGPSVGPPLNEKGSPGFDRKQLPFSFDGGLKYEERDSEKNQLKEHDSGPVSEGGLNFGKLTGGFRHKGINRPTFLQNQSDVSSSTNKEREEITTTPAFESPSIRTTFKHEKSRKTYLQSEPDSDSSEEEESSRKSFDRRRDTYTPHGKDVKPKPRLGASNSIFGSGNSDSDEDLPKESFRRRSNLHSGISRRTKAFPSIKEREPTKSYSAESQQQFQSERGNSSQLGNSELPKSVTDARRATDQFKSRKENPPMVHQSKFTQKSSAINESPKPKISSEASMNRENVKAATLSKTSSGDQNAGHVHPKLPDYDNLVQFLQKNRS